ncbi:pyridoxal-phosphate dependent enzyme [Candidatus Bathyarchaeota archaeon]|nr:pyridoxal-phosphate dependent enzyme [Candidatus Bathyarchaeota archaeon]
MLNFSQFWFKFEGGNPTGTMKDRASYATLSLAAEKGFKEIAVASCGNFGASVVHLSRLFSLKPHVYIPESFVAPRVAEMERQGGIIHRAPGTYEDLVDLSAEDAEAGGWYNGNPGTPENTRVSLEAYATIAYEVTESLGDAPYAVSVSVSNGTCFSGILHGFKTLKDKGVIESSPHMVAASTEGGNPIVQSFNEGRKRIRDLDPSSIVETEANEPIVNWRSLDGQEALDGLWASDGYALNVSDEALERYARYLEHEEGIVVLPASAAALVAMERYAKSVDASGGKAYVAVLTSRRH